MKTPSIPVAVIGAAVLLGLFGAGSLVGSAFALPLPAPLVGLALVLLGLRVGVMAAAVEEPPAAPARPMARGEHAREPALRAANG